MNKMDVTDLLGNNVTIDLVKSSPTKRMVILSAGAMKVLQDGKSKLNMLVEMDGRQINYMPNKTSLKLLAEKHGKETTTWVGKAVQLEVGVILGKDAVIAKPI
jgi:hypothetical protein